MKQGDFTNLAKNYHNRPGYSKTVLGVIANYVRNCELEDFQVADVGAGTGKLTEVLLEMGFSCVAVEPNDSMREEGIKYLSRFNVEVRKGSGEETGLEASFADWVLMGSSFHWTEPEKSLPEFHRILKPGGSFSAVWNPRNLEISEFHSGLERKISEIAPNIKRRSSGASAFTENMTEILVSTGHFKDPFFLEAEHELVMTRERYLGAWRSVNDIPAQAGPEKWKEIMNTIEAAVADMEEVVVPYKTRAYTARRID